MSIKNIAVYVDADQSCGRRVEFALDLANQHGAWLTGVFLRRQFIVPAYATVHIPQEVIEENERLNDEVAMETESRFREQLETTSVNGE